MYNCTSVTITETQYENILSLGYNVYEKKGCPLPEGFSSEPCKLEESDYSELSRIMKKYSLPFITFPNYFDYGNLRIVDKITNIADFKNLINACRNKRRNRSINVIFKTKEAFRSLLEDKYIFEELMDLKINIQTEY